MAENRPPRMIMRRLFGGGGGKVVHPRNEANAAPARMGGRMGGMGMGGGGVARGFSQAQASGDPALTGNFERMPYTTLYGFPIAGGGLSERGKEQQATSGRLQQYNQQIASAVQNGATFQEAFRGLVRSNPSALNDLMAHPTALQSMENLTQVLGGVSQHSFSGVSPQGQQVEFDENGKALGASDVPGFRGPPQKPQDVPKSQQPVKGPGGQFGTYTYGPGGATNFHPTSVEGQPQAAAGPGGKPMPVKATTFQQTQELSNIRTVLDNIDKLKNNLGATGSLGWGALNRLAAEKTPLSGTQGQAYNEAYNQITPALLALTRAPGISSQSKAALEILKDQLPDPNHAYLFNVNQVLPSIELQMRQRLADRITTYGAENRVGALAQATDMGKTYDAHPDMMRDITQSLHDLRTNPGAMPSSEVATLNREGQAGRLGYDDWLRVQRQGVQRGMISQDAYGQLVTTHPELGSVSDVERVRDPSMFKPAPSDQVTAGHRENMQPQPVTSQGVQPAAPAQAPAPVPTPAAQGDGGAAATVQQRVQEQQAQQSSGGQVPATPSSTPLPPLDPATLETLRQGGVPTGAIENQQGPAATPAAGATMAPAPLPQLPNQTPAASTPAPAVASPASGAENALPQDQGEASALATAAALQGGM